MTCQLIRHNESHPSIFSCFLQLTSVDRISQEDVKVRFFVLSNGRYVEGSKAKETFAQVSDYELSALITHPVGKVDSYL